MFGSEKTSIIHQYSSFLPSTLHTLFLFSFLFYQMWLTRKLGQHKLLKPATRDKWLCIPSVTNTSLFEGEAEYTIGEKSLHLVGFEPATFRLEASTLTNRPLVHPSLHISSLLFPFFLSHSSFFIIFIHPSYSYTLFLGLKQTVN